MSAQFEPPVDGHNLGPALLGVAWGFFAPATLMITARLHVRLVVRKNFGWDDFWIAAAWIFSLCTCIFTQLGVIAGEGQHLYYVMQTAYKLEQVLFYITVIEFTTTLAISLVKISVVAFILRLIKKTSNLRYVRWICYADLALFVPMTIAVMILLGLQCKPLSALWKEGIPSDKCMDRKVISNVFAGYSAISGASNLLTGILPVFILMGVQMKRSRKISIEILMGLGGCISAITIYKAVIAPTAFASLDMSYDLMPVAFVTSLEANLGIILASAPTLPPLFEGISTSSRFPWFHCTDPGKHDRNSFIMPHSKREGGSVRPPLRARMDRFSTRRNSEITLTKDGKAQDVNAVGLQSDSTILQTIDIRVYEQTDRDSVEEGIMQSEYPWLKVGRGLQAV